MKNLYNKIFSLKLKIKYYLKDKNNNKKRYNELNELQIFKINVNSNIDQLNLNNKIFSFILFLVIIIINFSYSNEKNNKIRKLDSSSYILVYINQTGTSQFLSQDFQTSPDKILINNAQVSSSIKSYNFESLNNTIKLTWNSLITNCSQMFYYCSNITSIDISNFDTSKVVSMSNMFDHCFKLISIDFTNIDTSSLTNMNSMFWSCNSLLTLDLSYFNTAKVVDMEHMFKYCYD